MKTKTYHAPTLTVVRIKAGYEPFQASDIKQMELSRDIGATATGGAAIISAAGEVGTAAGRISSITSPSHW